MAATGQGAWRLGGAPAAGFTQVHHEGMDGAVIAYPGLSGADLARAARALAGAIASIAALHFAGGLARDPAEIDANYVRRSDAELLWRDPR